MDGLISKEDFKNLLSEKCNKDGVYVKQLADKFIKDRGKDFVKEVSNIIVRELNNDKKSCVICISRSDSFKAFYNDNCSDEHLRNLHSDVCNAIAYKLKDELNDGGFYCIIDDPVSFRYRRVTVFESREEYNLSVKKDRLSKLFSIYDEYIKPILIILFISLLSVVLFIIIHFSPF